MLDTYVLHRDMSESQRLNKQHAYWTRIFGYLVHPTIFSHLNADSRIADIATGTGIFLDGLSSQLPPTCQLDGFDISDSQFMPPSMLPPNVSLQVHNAKQEFPDHLHGKYDLVHLRHLVMAFEEHDWQTVTANVVKLLKPGGAIQWVEADYMNAKFLGGLNSMPPMVIVPTAQRFLETVASRVRFGWNTLPIIFRKIGLESVYQDVVASDQIPELKGEITKCSIEGVFGWAELMLSKNTLGAWTREELDQQKMKCYEEITAGVYWWIKMYTVVGFTR